MLRKLLAIALIATPFLTIGCGSGSTNVTSTTPAPTAPYITVSATTLTFPSTTVLTASAAQTITVTNTGGTTAVLAGDATSGSGASDFILTQGTCTTSLAAGASCNLSVVFEPLIAGSLTATVTITDNASNSPQSVTLTGTGTAVVTGPPIATLTPATMTFTTAAGSVSATQIATLTNSGTGPLSIASIILGGTNLDQYTEAGTCGSSLAAGASCTLSIAFAPTQTGTFTATVTVTDNSNNVTGSTQTVALTGTSTGPLASINPASLTFPGTTVNTSATAQTVTLTNNGNAVLNISSIAITGGATAAAFAITANTCGATLAIAASCTVSVNFTPTATGSYSADYLTFTDNSAGSTQQVALSGTGQTAPAPIATLAPTTINFPPTVPATTSTAVTATLTNTGSATLNIASITLGGTNPTDFTETSTCGTTLAASASCNIVVAFKPAALATYTATVTITDNSNNVANSTQTLTLNGTGSTSTVYHNLYIFGEYVPSAYTDYTSNAPILALVNNATTSIDMTMYALEDTPFINGLVAACQRGVTVRVILDQNSEKSGNTAAYNALNAQSRCSAVWANKAFSVTHEKSLMIDGTIDVVMSLNLQSQYYSTTRDYAVVDNDAADYAADEATFAMDYAAGTPSSGVAGPSDFSYQPGPGDDLVWSPTTATTDMLAIINNATKTLYIECEEFSASNIVSAVAAAATRGVTVVLVGENESGSYTSDYTTIKNAGASVYYYSSSTGFYIHAKSVVADLGLPTEALYVGSINYSSASLTANRELGLYITGNTAVSNPIASAIQATTISDESQVGVTKF